MRSNYRRAMGLAPLLSGLSAWGLNAPAGTQAQDCSTVYGAAALARPVRSAADMSGAQTDEAVERLHDVRDAKSVAEDTDVAKQLVDPGFEGMVLLGREHDNALYFDKETEVMVATDGTASFVIDPASLAGATDGGERPATYDTCWEGVACRAACWGAAGAGCAAVSCVCAIGTVVTVGGFSIPCSWAIVAACAASGAGASVCSDYCTQAIGC